MRVSSKGQVTIPKHLREQLGIDAGCDVDLGIENGAIVVRRRPVDEQPDVKRGDGIVAAIRGTATSNRGLATDEIMKLLRDEPRRHPA